MEVSYLGREYNVVSINFLGNGDVVVIFYGNPTTNLQMVQMTLKEFLSTVKFI